MPYTGQPVKRFEDASLVAGRGSFVGDLRLPGMLHAAVVRSLQAHARIVSVDASEALAQPGVAAVLTADGLQGGVGDIGPVRREGVEDLRAPGHPVLARGKVRYVGQPVAVVVAEDHYLARDAADLVQVDLDPLPAVMDPLEAMGESAEPLHAEQGSNVVVRVRYGRGDVDAALAEADVVVRRRFEVPRLSAVPLEGRAVVARYEAGSDALTLWTSSQSPHRVKTYLADLLARPPQRIRVIAPDVGGGFGQKGEVWPEELAVACLAMRLGRPVKWVEERSENMLACHGRGYTADVEAAVRKDGTILALRAQVIADVGAYLLPTSLAPVTNVAQRVAGPYAIPVMEVTSVGVTTSKPPTAPYRGAGGPEAAFFTECTMDIIAAELGLDPAEVRRRALVPADAFPYETATGLKYDSGDFAPALERAMELAEYQQWRQTQAQELGRQGGRLLGIGVATVVKASGGTGESRTSSARVRVEPTGQVEISTEVHPHGQGTATSFAQIAADALGVRPDQVSLLHGDTETLAEGQGTYASRGLTVGGSAVYMAVQEVRDRLARAAAGMLECPVEDVVLEDGLAFRRDDRAGAVDLATVVEAAQEEQGLETLVSFTLPDNAFGFAAHVAVVEVDRDTGQVRFHRYVAVHDSGRVVNPLLAEGQVHGGIAQGIGMALGEGMLYDPDGQPLTATLKDYSVPLAQDIPPVTLELRQTPSTTNPLGTKGLAELPTVAAPAAVANAVVDALAPFGVRHLDPPLTADKVWRAINGRAT